MDKDPQGHLNELDFSLLASPQEISRSRKILLEQLGCPLSSVYETTQVHGSHVVWASGDPCSFRSTLADALLLRKEKCVPQLLPSPFVGVRTADCVAVLIANRVSGDVAAVHAGWRGVYQEILVKSGQKLLEPTHSSWSDLIFAMGPSIGPCCFEVDEDAALKLYNTYIKDGDQNRNDVELSSLFRNEAQHFPFRFDEKNKKFYPDLRAILEAQLKRQGVEKCHIDWVGGCTRCDALRYHSFRRDQKRSGRHLAIITYSSVVSP